MKEEIWEQDNPFRPEGELSREADAIIGAIKEGRGAITPTPPHLPQTYSSSQSEFDGRAEGRNATQEYSTSAGAGGKEAAVVKVERSLIVTSKTDDVEHVVIQEKESTCCACVIL